MAAGGNPRQRPDQLMQSLSRAGVGPAPQSSVVIARVVVIYGSGVTGLFLYSGTPGPGNDPILYETPPGVTKDPYGNSLPITSGGLVSSTGSVPPFRAIQLNQGILSFFYGSGEWGAIQLNETSGTPILSLEVTGSAMLYIGSFSNGADGLLIIPPSGDTTGVTDQANINLAMSLTGNVELTPGIFWTDGPILMPQSGVLAGAGYATQVKATSTFAGSAMVELAAGTVGQTTLRDLALLPDLSASAGGVLYDNTGYTGATPDSCHLLEDVWVYFAQGDGVAFAGASRTNRITRCHVVTAAGYGFNAACTDSIFTDCESQDTALHGYYMTGSNNRFNGCKSFFAGYVSGTFDTTHSGFYGNGCQYNTVVNCSGQQNALHGFDLQACTHTAVAGCEADTNNAGGGTGCGINLNGNFECAIVGNVGGNNTALSTYPPGQIYGVQVAGTQNGTSIIGNTIPGSTGEFGYVSGSGYLRIDTEEVDLSDVSAVKIGSVEWAPSPQLVLTNGETITWSESQGSYWLAPAGAVTGIILGTPVAAGNGNDMVVVTLVNMSAFNITFAAANIATGGFVLTGLTAQQMIWGGNGSAGAGSSLWYVVS